MKNELVYSRSTSLPDPHISITFEGCPSNVPSDLICPYNFCQIPCTLLVAQATGVSLAWLAYWSRIWFSKSQIESEFSTELCRRRSRT